MKIRMDILESITTSVRMLNGDRSNCANILLSSGHEIVIDNDMAMDIVMDGDRSYMLIEPLPGD